MLKKCTTLIVAGVAGLMFASQANADVLGVLTSGPGTGGSSWTAFVATAPGSSGLTKGAGLNFAPTGTQFSVTAATAANEGAAITAQDFVTWGLNTAQPWNLDTFSIRYQRSSTLGPTNLVIQLSTNGGASFTQVHADSGISTTGEDNLNIDLSAFDNVSSMLFRLVLWGAPSQTTSFTFLNTANIGGGAFSVSGSPVPEPAAAGLLGLAALGLLRRRRA